MTVQISKAVEEAMHGDEAVLKYIEIMHEAFLDGNRSALFYVLPICARYQALIPDWAADEILKMDWQLREGELKDFNEAFSWDGEHQATRKKKARLKKHTKEVLGLLQKHRLEGDSLNADDILQTVADVVGISRRDVEDIYRESGGFIKDLPRGNPDGGVFGIAHMELPYYRRRGRNILKG